MRMAAAQFAHGRPHSDFGMLWFGARALLRGIDPYSVIGPGKTFNYDWPLIYPGTALVAALPLAPFTEQWATAIFVGISAWLLAFGITRDGWYRVPLFITGAFISSVQLGQWSMLFTAALFLPLLAFLSIAKPQGALPILSASLEKRAPWAAVIGMVTLLSISLVMSPHWIPRWLDAIGNTTAMEPPIMRLGGPLLLITLFRWRRPETWLLLTLAALPQSWGWYNTLPLFAIPGTFAESVVLAGTAMMGAWYADTQLEATSIDGLVRSVGAVIVITIYLPAALMILRRKNEGPSPFWLRYLRRTRSEHATAADGHA